MARSASRKIVRKSSKTGKMARGRSTRKSVMRVSKTSKGRGRVMTRARKAVVKRNPRKMHGFFSNIKNKMNNMSDNSTQKSLEKIYAKNPELRPQ